ncbi:MAG: glutamine--tRNA ligase/YqeY domain fusion protein [Myxococcota bacterium]
MSTKTPEAAPADAPARDDDGQPGNFIADRVREEVAEGRFGAPPTIVTRFPPEPNGFINIGHVKSVAMQFGIAREHGGRCNLRFDDTNPLKEKVDYVEAIKEDIHWLGFRWDQELYASDYFGQLYAWAEQLVREGKAYVDERSEEEIRRTRGDFHTPGEDHPSRDRPPEESLALLQKMKAGEIDEGAAVLRAKIDMQSKDLKLRDPLMYRIRKVPHHRTGDEWCIYPMYDWAHGQSDAIEGITHSICTLEFVNHHALYDWFLMALRLKDAPDASPRQIEFGRMNLTHTVLSKRKNLQVVESGIVEGWDDPRMPTVSGLRRRGYSPEAIRAFVERIGVSKNDGDVDVGLLEHALRDDLNATSPRYMAVLRPLRLTITNYEGEGESFTLPHFADRDDPPTRAVPFGASLFVERDDFMKDPPKKWWRLAPGREVRLRGAALVTVTDLVEEDGEVVELRCTWDPESRGGSAPDGRRVRGTVHFVEASQAVDAEVRLFDRLYTVPHPEDAEGGFLSVLNPDSREVLRGCKLEPALGALAPETRVQFERLGYFVADRHDHGPGAPVFNRTITLKDSWAKLAKKLGR